MNKKNNNKGFTLAELLIVVAIIAVLVAIAIPVFTAQLEKSREATDAANIRNEYAKMMVEVLDAPQTQITGRSVSLKQQQDGWQNAETGSNLSALSQEGDSAKGEMKVEVKDKPMAGKYASLSYAIAAGDNPPTLTISFAQ